MIKKLLIISIQLLFSTLSIAQTLPPKQAYPLNVKQIHSGHSLTDPLFNNWPGQYVYLVSNILGGTSNNVGKSTIPGSSIKYRWENAPGYGQPSARNDIANWELLSITEGVPLLIEGANNAQWYLEGIQQQKEYLSLFVNNAWNNGNMGNGAPTLLWTTWTNIDNSNGPWRQMLDTQGAEFERMQDYANANKPAAAPPVYIIPGHKMMARIYDDIQLGNVPGITNISQLFSDNIHTNSLGDYAITLIHYACIYNTSPVGLTNDLLPSNNTSPRPSSALATYLQTIIWEVVTSYPRTGIYLQVDTIKPSVPTGLAISNTAQQSFTLSWTASTDNVGVSSYEIFRNGNSIGTTSLTTYSVTGLTCATAYTMTVRARDAARNISDASTSLIVNTPACIIDVAAPSVPTGLASSAITTSSFTLSWTASTDNLGVTGYDVYVNGNLRTSVTGTTVNLSDLTHSTTYSMTVRAKDAAGNSSAASTAINVTTNAITPGSTYRYLRLIAQGGVNPTYDLYFGEIDWMSGNTAYPLTHSSSGANITATQNQSNAWNAYDGNNASFWSPGVTTYPYSITIDLGSGVAIAPTAIQIAIEWNERALSAFTCLGSNDNTNWTILLTKSGLTSADWTRDAVNRFNFSTIITNISSESVSKDVHLYPNPSSTDINIESKNEIAMVDFFDLSGTLVNSKIMNSTSGKLSTDGLNSGLYMAKILLKDGNISVNKISIIK